MRRIPEQINYGKHGRDSLNALFLIVQREINLRTLELSELDEDDEHYPVAATRLVILTRLFKKLRARWEQNKPVQNITLDITEAMALWQVDIIGLDSYTSNVFRLFVNQTHQQLCNQPTLTALPVAALKAK